MLLRAAEATLTTTFPHGAPTSAGTYGYATTTSAALVASRAAVVVIPEEQKGGGDRLARTIIALRGARPSEEPPMTKPAWLLSWLLVRAVEVVVAAAASCGRRSFCYG